MAAAEEIWMPRNVHNHYRSLHTGMMVDVRNEGEVSDPFAITNGVRQGCVLAPTLFSIFLSAMLEEAFRDMGYGVYIHSRLNADRFTVDKRQTHKYMCERTAFSS